jgi:hypothetical protein
VQCALDGSKEPLSDERRNALLEREHELRNLYRKAWIPRCCRNVDAVFRRGFLKQITVDPDTSAERLSAILRVARDVRSLVIEGAYCDYAFVDMAEDGFPALRSRYAERLRELHLRCLIVDGRVARHLANTRLDSLRVLGVSPATLDAGSLRTLLLESDFPLLERMDLDLDIASGYERRAVRDLRAFAAAPETVLPSLTTLQLDGALKHIGHRTLRLLRAAMRKRGGKLLAHKRRSTA